MRSDGDPRTKGEDGASRHELSRSFGEFLRLPTEVVAASLCLVAATLVLDKAGASWLATLRDALATLVFGSGQATSRLLAVVVTGLITITSITFSVLLLAVQQAAGSMTHQVIDQFLRRKLNQGFFGYFVGLAVYCLIVLATVQSGFNPVISASVALVLTVAALSLLVVLIYDTINQIRPANIVDAIPSQVLNARQHQVDLVRATRRHSRLLGPPDVVVTSSDNGFLVGVDTDALARLAGEQGEVVVRPSLGSYVSFGDVVAEVRQVTNADAGAAVTAVRRALALDRVRDVDHDAAYEIHQLVDVAWTSISTSKQSPEPGLLTILALRDLLARWSAEGGQPDDQTSPPAPVVYHDDTPERLMAAFESLVVVASESMQAQSYAEVVRALAVLFDRLDADYRRRAEEVVRRILPALGDEVLTIELDRALIDLVDALRRGGCGDTAATAEQARSALATSVGTLSARGRRVPTS